MIFGQIDSSKIQSSRLIGESLFTFPSLLKHKTDFAVINLPQCITATICAKLHRHVSHNIRIAGSSENWNEKCCTVAAWCEQHHDPSIVLTEQERKDCFEHTAKNQTAVFQSGTFLLQKVETRKGKKLSFTRNCVYGQNLICSFWVFSGRCISGRVFLSLANNQHICIQSYSLVENHHCGPKPVLFGLILTCKRKIGNQNFPYGDQKFWFVFRCKEEIY